MSPRSQSQILLEKIREQADIAERLISLIPIEALEWRPEILAPLGLSDEQAGPKKSDQPTSTPIEPVSDLLNSSNVKENAELLPLGYLLGHILDCMAGFCALLHSASPTQLAHFRDLRDREVNHFSNPQEARARLQEYMQHIEEGFALLNDSDLTMLLPTVFVPDGEPILTLILGNLEHLINHKYQIFLYLRLMGIPVGTGDLYRFRSQPG